MAQVPDGIFDMVRAICSLSGMKVLFDTAQIALSELYIDDCPTCEGAGIMTCPFCKGSKTLRARPMRLVRNSKGVAMMLHGSDSLNECWHCGPPSKLDFKMESEDVNDEMESLRIMENFSAAMAGRPMPFEWEPLAGTVPCSMCMGSKVMHRHTPNIGKAFALGDDMWTKIEKKVGVQTYSGQSREFYKLRRLTAFLEYPKHPPPFPEDMIEFPTLRVHPILIPELEDVEKDEKPNPEDLSNPFMYALPWLEMKSELNVGDPEAFP